MRNIVVGTAGHVDHGKTQLIKALSGIDTDRLAEERERGITIEAGFADIPNNKGYDIGVIDVPGHEKFIKNMLAGIGGIDFVIFVIAADEGIMPQTREHFEILRALGVDDGIIAITKIDMVDDEWLDMLADEVREYFSGSFLDGKPMFFVSAKTGKNIDALRDEIIKKCAGEIKRIENREQFRLPVDRVFSMQGFGTVVTGTLIDGACSLNDEIYVCPGFIKAKIRGIQVHGKDVPEAYAGQRTAINIAGIKKEDIRRGDVIAAEHAVCITNMLDVSMSVFESSDRAVMNNSRVHIYIGSKEALCKVILLDRDELGAGERCYAQLRLEEPVAVRRGDKFIIRFYSPVVTIGGGKVLDAAPEKHKRMRDSVLEQFAILENGDIAEITLSRVNGQRWYTVESMAHEIGVLPSFLNTAIEDEVSKSRMIKLNDGSIIGADRFEVLKKVMTDIISEYHTENPLDDGIPKQELLSRLKESLHIEDSKKITSLLAYMLKSGVVLSNENAVSLPGFKIEYTDEHNALKSQISKIYSDAGIDMVKNDEIFKLGTDKNVISAIISDLISEGVIIKVDAMYNVSSEGWEIAVNAAKKIGASPFTLAEYRDALGTSRKYASIFLQAFDKAKLTIFSGERRSFLG